MPIVLSMCQGGICRVSTRAAIDFAHGRTCSYVINDMGAIDAGRWHDSHFSWKIGAMSLVNVGDLAVCADRGEAEPARTQPAATTPAAAARHCHDNDFEAITLLLAMNSA